MNPDKFVWTSEEYTCEELRDKFDNKFPVIALVTTGYYGDKEHEQIGTDTVSICIQKNIISTLYEKESDSHLILMTRICYVI